MTEEYKNRCRTFYKMNPETIEAMYKKADKLKKKPLPTLESKKIVRKNFSNP